MSRRGRWTVLVAASVLLCVVVAWSQGRHVDMGARWVRSHSNTLSGFRNMYNLHTIRDSSGPYRYRGWFFGWACEDCNRNVPGFEGCDAIFAARAKDLDGPWEVHGDRGWVVGMPDTWRPVLAPRDQYSDEWHNGDPSVVKLSGRYYMAYSSVGHNRDRVPYGAKGDTDGSLLCIGGAVSTDGLAWRRSSGPMLVHASDVGGAPVPEGEAHLYGSFNRPTLLREAGRWRLWFDYWAGAAMGVSMGYAENSGDFMNAADWRVVRAGPDPCLERFPNPDVVRVGDILLAYGDPPDGDPHPWISRKITEAVSLDGLHWAVTGRLDSDADAAALHVAEALASKTAAGWRVDLIYSCQIGGEPYNYRYDRIRRMHQILTKARLAELRSAAQSVIPRSR